MQIENNRFVAYTQELSDDDKSEINVILNNNEPSSNVRQVIMDINGQGLQWVDVYRIPKSEIPSYVYYIKYPNIVERPNPSIINPQDNYNIYKVTRVGDNEFGAETKALQDTQANRDLVKDLFKDTNLYNGGQGQQVHMDILRHNLQRVVVYVYKKEGQADEYYIRYPKGTPNPVPPGTDYKIYKVMQTDNNMFVAHTEELSDTDKQEIY